MNSSTIKNNNLWQLYIAVDHLTEFTLCNIPMSEFWPSLFTALFEQRLHVCGCNANQLKDLMFCTIYRLQIATRSQSSEKKRHIHAYRFSLCVGFHMRLMRQMLHSGPGFNFLPFRIMHRPREHLSPM